MKDVNPTKAAICSTDSQLIRASVAINKTIESAKSAATSQTAIGYYIAGGWLLTSSYAAWGVYENSSSQSSS